MYNQRHNSVLLICLAWVRGLFKKKELERSFQQEGKQEARYTEGSSGYGRAISRGLQS